MVTGGHGKVLGAAGRLRVVTAVVIVTVASGGCASIGERKAQAERIVKSADLAEAQRTANLTLTQRIELKLDAFGDRAGRLGGGGGRGGGAPEGAPAGGGAPADAAAQPPAGEGAPATPGAAAFAQGALGGPTGTRRVEVSVPGVVDLENDRVAMLYVQEGAEPLPVTVFNGTSLYVRRGLPGQEAASGASASRPWVRLDLAAIDPDDIDNAGTTVSEASERLPAMRSAASPTFLLRLLRGALTGSVRQKGTEEIDGVLTTHYTMNVDREKATDHESEDVAETYETVFKSMFVNSVVIPAEVWIDDQGLPRRFLVTFEPKIRRRTFAEFIFQVDFRDFAAPVTVAVPTKQETVRVQGFGSLASLVQR